MISTRRALYRNSLIIIMMLGAVMLAFIHPALAQQVNIDLGQGGTVTARVIQLIAFLTIITLAPSLLVMVTSFIRIVVVLSILRVAMGTQQTPPNSVLISLALFMTFFIMQPALQQVYDNGIAPLIAGQIDEVESYNRSVEPVRDFMLKHVRESDLALFIDIGNIGVVASPQEVPMRVLVPSFMISELRRAFEIGFLLFIPFLIIDLVVASVLMSMGMLLLPPIIISLPFKLVFFVLVDGWNLVAGSLVQSFGS